MFNKVIVSTDDSHFKDFWPLVCIGWKKFFPEVKIVCGFVTNRMEDDTLIKDMRQYGEVHIFPIVPNIPTASQGKMTRLILASKFDDEICLIDDIDSVPLQKSYLTNIFTTNIMNKIKEGNLVVFGANVYKNTSEDGKFPMGYITGKSSTFKKLINSTSKTLEDLYNLWSVNKIDNKESVLNTPIENFSDESLLRLLLKEIPIQLTHIDRTYEVKNYWIDRSWWNINSDRLYNLDYIMCNFLRPYSSHIKKIEPIKKFLEKK